MIKGDLLADIFDSPETIAQARREGYSLADPADVGKHGGDLDLFTKIELLELARQKGIVEKSLTLKKKSEIIDLIKAAPPAKLEDPEGGADTGGAGDNPPPGPGPENPGGDTEAGQSSGNQGEGAGAGPSVGEAETQEAGKKESGIFG
jgi:hypothetical protein